MAIDTNEILEQYKKAQSDMKEIQAKLNEYSIKVENSLNQNNNLSEEMKAKLDESLIVQSSLQNSVRSLEQIVAKSNTQAKQETSKNFADLILNNADFKASFEPVQARKFGSAGVSIKAALTSFDDVGTVLIEPHKRQFIKRLDAGLKIKDLLGYNKTSSNQIPYVVQEEIINKAAHVEEGEEKPESSLKFTDKDSYVDTFAHMLYASKQILDDVPALQSIINNDMLQGLRIVEELAILYGEGKIVGLFDQATDFEKTKYANLVDKATPIDLLRLAMLQSTLSNLIPDAIVLNPMDWVGIELIKTDNGAYIFANPQGVATKTLWGKKVVESVNIRENEFLLGNFKQGATYWDREQFNFQMSTQDGDNFKKNMVSFRAEGRFGLAVTRPKSFIKGDLTLLAAKSSKAAS